MDLIKNMLLCNNLTYDEANDDGKNLLTMQLRK